MKQSVLKIAAALSAAVLCAVPAASNISADAATSQIINIRELIPPATVIPLNPYIAADYLFGDVNHDQEYDGRDASCVLSYPYTYGTTFDTKLADVNNDRRIDSRDANIILDVYAKRSARIDLTGDANNDGEIDMADVILLQQHASNPSRYRIANMMYADVNRDALVNEVDANLVQRYKLGCFSSFNINFGDVVNDAELTEDDYNYISYFYGQTWNNKTIPADVFNRCDANGDGVINSTDRTTIYNAVHGYGYRY